MNACCTDGKGACDRGWFRVAGGARIYATVSQNGPSGKRRNQSNAAHRTDTSDVPKLLTTAKADSSTSTESSKLNLLEQLHYLPFEKNVKGIDRLYQRRNLATGLGEAESINLRVSEPAGFTHNVSDVAFSNLAWLSEKAGGNRP